MSKTGTVYLVGAGPVQVFRDQVADQRAEFGPGLDKLHHLVGGFLPLGRSNDVSWGKGRRLRHVSGCLVIGYG